MEQNDLNIQEAIGSSGGTDTYTIFLGLYLLILAFFIILVSISSHEEVKSKAVQDSLTSTFSNIMTTSSLTTFTGQTGEIVAGQQFEERIEGLFASAVQVAKVKIVQAGRQMRVILPADSLFFPGKAEIRPAQFQLLDRMVASLSNRPPGWRYEMEFVIGSKYVVGESLPIGETLEVLRGGAFAREMRARGAPPNSMSIGLEAGNPAEITFWFFMRDEDDEPVLIESTARSEGPAAATPSPMPTMAPNEALIPPAPSQEGPKASIPLPPLAPPVGQ